MTKMHIYTMIGIFCLTIAVVALVQVSVVATLIATPFLSWGAVDFFMKIVKRYPND